MSSRSVLIVDDELDFLEGLGSLLDDAGYQVRTATSATDGIEQLKKDCPNLILLDLMMPGMRGLTTLRYIRETKNICKIPVVLMSASREPIDEGVMWDAFLAKPFDIDEALSVVARFLG